MNQSFDLGAINQQVKPSHGRQLTSMIKMRANRQEEPALMIKSQIDISADNNDPQRKGSIVIDVPNLKLHKDHSEEKMTATFFNYTGRGDYGQNLSLMYGRRTERRKNVKKLTGNFPELYQKFFKNSSHDSIDEGSRHNQSLNSSLINSRNLVQP